MRERALSVERERILRERAADLVDARADLASALSETVALLERELEQHPDDDRRTPMALLLLGEIHLRVANEEFRSRSEEHAQLVERYERGQLDRAPEPPERDYSMTVETLGTLVRGYPSWERLDDALYLLGYAFYETGQFESARLAFLCLVCSNEYEYRGPVAEPQTSNSGFEGGQDRVEPFVDPYSDCAPALEGSESLQEAWLRVGEHHFDFDYTRYGLDRAISAYRHALEQREGRHTHLAMYKLAWSYYRLDRYPDAIRTFIQLIEHYDESGSSIETVSALRPEALQYLGICFAEDDWDGDMEPDDVSGLERVQDPALLPQNRPYTIEVYRQTADTFFDLARYDDAVTVYDLILRRWPDRENIDRIYARIIEAHRRNRRFDEAERVLHEALEALGLDEDAIIRDRLNEGERRALEVLPTGFRPTSPAAEYHRVGRAALASDTTSGASERDSSDVELLLARSADGYQDLVLRERYLWAVQRVYVREVAWQERYLHRLDEIERRVEVSSARLRSEIDGAWRACDAARDRIAQIERLRRDSLAQIDDASREADVYRPIWDWREEINVE